MRHGSRLRKPLVPVLSARGGTAVIGHGALPVTSRCVSPIFFQCVEFAGDGPQPSLAPPVEGLATAVQAALQDPPWHAKGASPYHLAHAAVADPTHPGQNLEHAVDGGPGRRPRTRRGSLFLVDSEGVSIKSGLQPGVAVVPAGAGRDVR